jgi:F-type H+-transporting ATPase subunit b
MAEMKHELGRLVVDTTARVTGKVLSPADHQRINEETARQIAA